MKVYETDDYSVFKTLKGNRETIPGNIKKLSRSMRDHGWIGAPVVVNENMEIIDGQNRILGAKDAGVIVPYIICKGYGVDECILLNRNVRNWNTTDYVYSYASQDFESYVWLKDLKDKYSEFSMDDLGALAWTCGRSMTSSSDVRDKVRDGQLDLQENDKDIIIDTLEFLKQYSAKVKKIGGRKFILYNTILYCRTKNEVDLDKLLNKVFLKDWAKITASTTVYTYLVQIVDIYNKGLQQNARIFIHQDYEKRYGKDSKG